MEKKEFKDKKIYKIKAEDSSNMKIFEALGFSAFSNISNNIKLEKQNEAEKKDNETKKQREKLFISSLGFNISESTECIKSEKKTKKISKKEVAEFNKKYIQKLQKIKKNLDNSNGKEGFKKHYIINFNSFFNKKNKNDILKNRKIAKKQLNEEIKKEKKEIFRLEKQEKRDKNNKKIKKDIKENLNFTIKQIKYNLKIWFKYIKKNISIFINKNIKNKLNRRKNILNLLVIIPIIILVIINIVLIENILKTNKAKKQLIRLKEETIKFDNNSEEIKKEIEKIKTKLKNNQEE